MSYMEMWEKIHWRELDSALYNLRYEVWKAGRALDSLAKELARPGFDASAVLADLNALVTRLDQLGRSSQEPPGTPDMGAQSIASHQ